MATFTIHVAQSVRAYGFVEVEADTIDKAVATVDHDFIFKNFSPYGYGKDDFDYANATGVALTSWDVVFEDGTGGSDDLDVVLPDAWTPPHPQQDEILAVLNDAATVINIGPSAKRLRALIAALQPAAPAVPQEVIAQWSNRVVNDMAAKMTEASGFASPEEEPAQNKMADDPIVTKALGQMYTDLIGYNPFHEDSAETNATVAQSLAEFVAEKSKIEAEHRAQNMESVERFLELYRDKSKDN